MNISDHKKTAGQAHPAKLKDRIQKTAEEKTEKIPEVPAEKILSTQAINFLKVLNDD